MNVLPAVASPLFVPQNNSVIEDNLKMFTIKLCWFPSLMFISCMNLPLVLAGDDTWLFPLLQLPPFMVLQDSSVTEDIFKCLPANSTVHLCSPYFNLTEQYILSLLHKCKAPVKVLIPHPTVSCHKVHM